MKHIVYSLCLLIFPSQLFADEYLRIGDVQNSWSTYNGSIDKAVVLVTPKGLYAECQMYLDFSVNCTPFTNPQDSLEIQMGFRLPVEAEVIDLWLWINGVPVRANVYDRWTASQIYESFVDRRTDPALLVKQSDSDYELHIFPMMVNLPRKIKITFLLPLNKLTGAQSQVILPLNILKLSECPIDMMQFAIKPELNLDNPQFLELPQQSFQFVNDPTLGECYTTNLSEISQLSSLTLSLNATAQANYFAGYEPDNGLDEGVYQLELDLADILGLPDNKKTLFLIDFIDENSSLSRTHVLQTLKNYIATWFGPGDSVNFMFSGLLTNLFSNNWRSADSASLSQIFNDLDSTLMTNSSNLPVLLLDGINYIQSHENEGNILLIASSDQFSNTEDANDLFDDIKNFMGPDKVPIHTINLDDVSYMNYLGNNTYYRGNEYLYTNLSVYTGGEFQTVLELQFVDYYYWYYESVYNSYETMLGKLFPKLTDYFTALDVYASLQTGFTYANYTFTSMNGFVYFGSPFRQTGKYYGTFPMEISISAVTSGGELYNSVISLDAGQLHNLDSSSMNLWAGQYLRSMLSYTQTSTVVAEIIQTSKSERVLCKYTAFLALEPEIDTIETVAIPITVSSGPAVGINESGGGTITNVSCYPNPVSSIVIFEFTSDEAADVTIEIYNLQGVKVATVLNEKSILGHQVIQYDVSDLLSGSYFYRVITDNRSIALGKMIVIK